MAPAVTFVNPVPHFPLCVYGVFTVTVTVLNYGGNLPNTLNHYTAHLILHLLVYNDNNPLE